MCCCTSEFATIYTEIVRQHAIRTTITKESQISPFLTSSSFLQTNGFMQTSNPDVYAVGDVAAFPLKKYGITTRQEHVANARSSASHAVTHILSPGELSDYDYLPFFYSRIFNLSWQVRCITVAFLSSLHCCA